MKLTMEIKDKEVVYSYEIGESSGKGTRHLCTDFLRVFVDVQSFFWRHQCMLDKEWERQVYAKAWLEKQPNPEKVTE